MRLDLRLLIGWMFLFYGLLLTFYGLLGHDVAFLAEPRLWADTQWGIALLVFGLIVLLLRRCRGG